MTNKKFDIIHFVIVIAGIICAYNGVILLPQVFIFFYNWIDGGLKATVEFSNLVLYLVLFAFYILAGMFIIRRSSPIAEYIVHRSGLHSEVQFTQSKTDLLYCLFIGLGIYNILEKVPILFRNLYLAFSEKVSRSTLDTELHSSFTKSPGFTIPLINLLLTILLLAFAKDLAIYFAGKITNADDIAIIGEGGQ